MSKAVIFFAPGLEECEGLLCVDILRRAGVEVTIAAVGAVCILLGAVVGGKIAGKLNADVMRTVVYLFVGVSGLILLLQQL